MASLHDDVPVVDAVDDRDPVRLSRARHIGAPAVMLAAQVTDAYTLGGSRASAESGCLLSNPTPKGDIPVLTSRDNPMQLFVPGAKARNRRGITKGGREMGWKLPRRVVPRGRRAAILTVALSLAVPLLWQVALVSSSSADELTPPTGAFVAVSAGNGFTCAIRSDHELVCWGSNNDGKATPPAGEFTAVSAGFEHACAVKSDATLACWGYNFGEPITPPAGSYVAVATGSAYDCALAADAAIACWGSGISGQASPPAGMFEGVSTFDAGDLVGFTCGLKTDATLTCWGFNSEGDATPPSGTFTALSSGEEFGCALATAQTLACWGSNYEGESTPPPGEFTAVSAGGRFACAIRSDETLACWGLDLNGVTSPPSGTFTAVSAGLDHACAIRTDGTLVCWGTGYEPPISPTGQEPSPTGPGASLTDSGSTSTSSTLTTSSAPVTGLTASPKPKQISPAAAFTLPSAKQCVSRRRFVVHVRKLPGITWVGAVIKINHKRIKTLGRSHITALVNLVSLPKGTFVLSITAKASNGQTVTGTRTYHTCVPKSKNSYPAPRL